MMVQMGEGFAQFSFVKTKQFTTTEATGKLPHHDQTQVRNFYIKSKPRDPT